MCTCSRTHIHQIARSIKLGLRDEFYTGCRKCSRVTVQKIMTWL